MPLEDLVVQLQVQKSEHQAALGTLNSAEEVARQAITARDAAKTSEGKEKADVKLVLEQLRDAIQAEIDGLEPTV